ncbi:MAG: LysM peptidoglycan-binding domain-containing protein [Tannerella sp.]|jgi:LysM repeat protein|nr:LysM peptidoglycan-binding domain-containing protein [Tannerella sp.]
MMKKITLFALLVLGCIYFTQTGVVAQTKQQTVSDIAQSDNIFYHTVERGQTIYSIATMYGVKVDEILKLNAMTDDAIKVGATLKIPQKKAVTKPVATSETDKSYIYHTIAAKETLYGVAKMYSVTGQQIIDANPGLSAATFSIGKNIRIPTNVKEKKTTEVVDKKKGKEVYYTVPEKETMYNICRTFKTTEKELLSLNPELAGGLRIGMTLRIPLRINVKDLPAEASETPRQVEEMLTAKPAVSPVDAARIALLLPYDAEKPNVTGGAMTRFIAYYEGILLAVDSLRKQGYSSEFFVYDIGEQTSKLKKLLIDKEEALKDVNLIIGGSSNEQIKLIADFARNNKVKYVIPFTQKNDEVLNNAYVFQVNTPKEYLYANAAYAGTNLFAKYNIIFLDTKDANDDRSDFIEEFKKELKERNIAFQDLTYNAAKFKSDISALLSTSKPNMVMPYSASLDALNKFRSTLRALNQAKPEYNITLFGYPDWQTTQYKECLDDFHTLDTYIYSLFFADNMNPGVKNFYNDYKKWYSKMPDPAMFPKYEMVGFDTGMFFLQAIKKYGADFEKEISNMKYKSVQTGFNFERVNNWGGFINTNIYIIHFDKDFRITRSEFK